MNARTAASRQLEETTSDSEFLREVLEGLSATPKTLPCKYFYDEEGSELFKQICELDEYYLTRTELSLLKNIQQDLAQHIGADAQILEPGSGAGEKIKTLLHALDAPNAYIPIDISEGILVESASVIQNEFPALDVHPVVQDFTQPLELPAELEQNQNPSPKKVVFFPGSTIGNFNPAEATEFLSRFADWVGQGGGLVIGVDLVKAKDKLEAAYDDALGVTAAFNKNLLVRINNELGAGIDLDNFEHLACYNQAKQRIEMHLRSTCEQEISIGGQNFHFKANETIHTENSYKYKVEDFQQLAQDAGFRPGKTWTDPDELFSIHYLEAA